MTPHAFSLLRSSARFVAAVVVTAAALGATGCLSRSSRQVSNVTPPPAPNHTVFQRQVGAEPHFFFDERAKEIERSLGVGGQ